MFPIDRQTLVIGALVFVATASSRLSVRSGIPFLLVFVVIGMLAGSEGIGGIDFNDFSVAHSVGSIALILILFDGGLNTSKKSIRNSWVPATVLATCGVLLTSAVVGGAAFFLLDLPLPYGLLLGSIVGSTDAAAVFAALRSSALHIRPRLASTLEVESGSNDPMAVLMTIGFIEYIQGEIGAPSDWGLFLLRQLVLGGAMGWLGGRGLVMVVNRLRLQAAGLYPILTLAGALLTYGATATLGGSGFLAVYIAGVIVGNRRVAFQRGIWLFHDGMAWLGQIVMFIALGLLSTPSELLSISGDGLAIAAVLVLVARPAAVVLCLAPLRFDWREIAFASWAGLRGAVPIILATYPLLLGVEAAYRLFHLVFFVVLVSVLVQGSSLPLVARLLRVDVPAPPAPPLTVEITSLHQVDADILAYLVDPQARAANKRIDELYLPEGLVIIMVVREEALIPPLNTLVVRPKDHVFVMLRPRLRWLADHVFTREGTAVMGEAIAARLSLGEVHRQHGIPLPGDEGQTLDEFMRSHLESPPQRGDQVRLGMLAFTVLDVRKNGEIGDVGVSLTEAPHHGKGAEQVEAEGQRTSPDRSS